MTRKAVISAAELKRMAEVANSEGVTVEFERDGAIVRVMPFSHHRFKKNVEGGIRRSGTRAVDGEQ